MNILVVADHSLSRVWIASLLTAAEHRVIGQLENGISAFNAAVESMPDLVLLDIDTPNLDWLKVLLLIKGQCPNTKVVLLTVRPNEDDMLAAIEKGADGCLMKDLNAIEFLDGIAGLKDGRLALSRRISASLMSRFLYALGQELAEPEALPAREAAVLELMGDGMLASAIGDWLPISESRAK